jgi:acyl-CoA synthetase (AMP-forming)/AMP-acid ligase II
MVLRNDVIRTIDELLSVRAEEAGDSVAFSDGVQSVTYRDLDARVRRLAGHLLDGGLQKEDRVLLFLDNRVEVVESYLAAPIAGLVTVCANPMATPAELSFMVKDSGARVLVTDAEHLSTALRIASEHSSIERVVLTGSAPDTFTVGDGRVVLYETWMASEPKNRTFHGAALDDWSWMLYTSGTTGQPKGVHLTQRSCLWVVAACWLPIAGLNGDDYVLSALPLFHSYALVLCVLGVVAAGARLKLLRKFSPKEVLAILHSEPVTFLPGVPTMFHYMMDRTEKNQLDAPALRLCVSAGALMQPTLNAAFEKFSGVPLLDGYGITETSTMVTMNSPSGGRVLGSCGFPLPGVTVRIIDPITQTDVAPLAEGEMWVQGPNVMLGYHNRPEADAQALTNGWYHTGDLAKRDENGFLFISGRLKEMIIRGGENIYPAEIEAVLVACETVSEAVVVGIPHPALGEVPVAFVIPADERGVDEEAVLTRCAELLSYFKVPAQIVEVQEIPRTASGKIQRYRLQELLSANKA